MSIFTPTGYSKTYCLLHPWAVAAHKLRDIKCAYQRATKGYCFRDIWNIDEWFLEIMPEMLDDFIKTHHGHPSNMTDEEWIDILQKMSKSLKNAHECNTEFVNPYDEEFSDTLEFDFNNHKFLCHANKELKENYYLYEEKKREFLQNSLDEGISLFHKYLRDLWD